MRISATIYLIDHYANNLSSPMHKASTLSKLISAIVALGITIFTNSALALMSEFLIILTFIAAAKLPMSRLVSWALYPAFFASLFALSQIPYSLVLPIITIFKAINAALIMLFLISTTPYPELFSILGTPSKTLGNVAFLTYRFFFLFIEQTGERFKIMKARGGLAGNWKTKITNLAHFIGMLFVSSFETSENMYAAMKTRGYSGSISYRKKLRRKFSKQDLMPIAFALCIFAIVTISMFLKAWGVFV
jgi:cobalt/nickel transport system permease protein